MNVAIVLAGLTPRAKQIDGIGFGGAPVWKFEDRIALLSGLKGPELDWAYYRYCGHEARLLPVLRHVQFSVDMYCGINRIRISRETRAGIVKVALMDMTSAICTECDGKGHRDRIVINLTTKEKAATRMECPRCHGSGRERLSGRGMAAVCGIDHKSWGRSHDAVLAEAMRILAHLDNTVFRNAYENTDE